MITFNNIVERFEIFAENHFFIQTFSFGSPDDVDLTKFTNFPLMHLVYTGATYDAGTKTYNLEVYILDVPADKNQKVERQKEVVSDAEQCAEDIIADIKNGGNIFLFAQDYEVVNATTTPLEEETKNVLSGVLLDLSVAIPYEWDACNAPIDGVEPGGTEVTYARRGVLRMLTLDGATDVPSVRTIKVTNGTLTDNGDGVVTLDTGGVDTLAGLTDVDVTGVTDGQVLKYDDASGEWLPGNDQSATSLGNLDDVSLVTPANREALIYDGDNWVNDNVTKADVGLGNVENTSDADKPVSTATQTALNLKANTADVPTELNDLSDVSLTTPTANQALIYNTAASAFQALPSYTNRFQDEAEQASNTAVTGTTLFIERYYSAKADGDGIFIDAQSDTPTAGKVIRRKIYQIAGGLDDSTITGWTLIHTFADDTAYSATTSTFEGFRDGDTYGTPPFSLAQTWEEVTSAPSFTGLLNESYGSGAEAAYSTRRLNGNYSGDCMTIRRASDGTTQSIGFVGEEIDESAIETFCTGTTCTVQVWRDQSGNGYDATQTTAANQPTIYTGGQLVKDGGRLAVNFDGSNDFYNTSLNQGTLTGFFYTAVVAPTTTTALQSIVDLRDANDDGTRMLFINDGRVFTSTDAADASANYAATQQIVTGEYDGTNLTTYIDGVGGTSVSGTNTTATANALIGVQLGASSFHMNGTMQELIMYFTDKSANRTDIEGNISAYFQSAKLLDEQFGEGAEAAYSTRQLRRDQTDCMVIRRASDSTTQTIGFDSNGNIDEAAIETFCSGTTCTVYQWLDQSGNGNTATAPSTGDEPTIYIGGALVKENGKVAVNYGTASDSYYLELASYTSLSYQSISTITVGSNSKAFNAEGSISFTMLGLNTSPRYYQNIGLTGGLYFSYDALEAIQLSSTSQNSQYLSTVYANNSTASAYFNGTSKGSVTSVSGNSAYIALGYNGGTSYHNGNIQEIILYGTDKSSDRTSIESNIGDYFTQNTPLLDTYSGAAAAYSLRKLSSSYSGSAVEVYNGSSYADIGFNVFGELDTVALAAHCGSNDGFVSTWYDQAGSNDATQTTTASMPKIYDGTTGVITENGKPAVNFDGSDDFLEDVSKSASLTGHTLITVVKTNTTAVEQRFLSNPNGGANILNLSSGNYMLQDYELSPTLLTQATISADTTQSLLVGSINSTDKIAKIWKNGTQGTNGATLTKTLQLLNTAETDMKVGANRIASANFVDGYIQEMIYYPTDQDDAGNRTGIEDNINTFYSIY